ncbi:MAG: amidohydrolase [Peptococcaceae bacterium]|nr:amidohydrolase [Peptococcaceae bacterium]
MSQQLYYNGTIITVNNDMPEAEAVLVDGETIKAVGSLADVEAQAAADAQKIDLAGKVLLPGFVDGHSHITFSRLFPRFDAPPIGEVDSREKLIEAGRDYLEKNPMQGDGWLVGMGYDNIAFADHKHPTKEDIDKISTEVPIVMMHSSGHIGVCNSKVLEIVGITNDTPDPEGGIFQRDLQTGEITGVCEENALTQVVLMKMPMPTPEFMAAGVLRSQALYFENGVTTAQDGTFDPNLLPLLQGLNKQGALKIDIYGYPTLDSPNHDYMLDKRTSEQHYENGVRLAGVKMFLDGSPQAKTAWLTEPYYKVPEGEADDYRGYPVYPDDDKVCNFFKETLTSGLQLLVHCNGDAAIDQYITQYARAQKETGITEALRPIVIHCQTVREDQLDRMQEIGMMPSYFHDHVLFWGDWHLDSVLGPERGRRISPLASSVKRGMPFSLHQDCPVAPPNMVLAIHNAVNRKTQSGRDIGPEFAIDPMEAIRAVTIYAAYGCFEEDTKGSIEAGKLADFVILDKDPRAVEKMAIRDIKVMETIKKGESVYKAE